MTLQLIYACGVHLNPRPTIEIILHLDRARHVAGVSAGRDHTRCSIQPPAPPRRRTDRHCAKLRASLLISVVGERISAAHASPQLIVLEQAECAPRRLVDAPSVVLVVHR